MRRLSISGAVFLAACFLIPPADAEMCTLDVVPAATLLAPYFEVDLADPGGTNTLITLHNTRAEPALVKIALWTDYSLLSVYFDVYLTGFDVVRFDLGDAFRNGNLPITADRQSDPDDDISPAGNPAWDGDFPLCDDFFPFYVNPVISPGILDRIRNGHTGRPVAALQDECMGSSYNDDVARGYVTIDNVVRCSLIGPNQDGYFDGNDPVASNENVLWGEWSLFDPSDGSSFTESLVHIEADPNFDAQSTPTGYTFYGRYTRDEGGADHREPLGNAWGARYLDGGPFTGGADFIVWRDSTASITPASVPCDGSPDWFPLEEKAVTCWSEEEDVTSLCEKGACFPLETQRVSAGTGAFSPPWDFGWCSLELDIPGDAFPGDVDFPADGGDTAQSWVGAVTGAAGRFSMGFGAVELGHPCDTPTPTTYTGENTHE